MPTKKFISTLLLVAGTFGCYAWRTDALSPQVITTTPPVGIVRVTLIGGRRFEVADPRITGDTLLGRSVGYYDPSRSQPLTVPLSQIQWIETRHFDSGRTAGLMVGLVSIAVVAFIIVSNVSTDLGCVPACN